MRLNDVSTWKACHEIFKKKKNEYTTTTTKCNKKIECTRWMHTVHVIQFVGESNEITHCKTSNQKKNQQHLNMTDEKKLRFGIRNRKTNCVQSTKSFDEIISHTHTATLSFVQLNVGTSSWLNVVRFSCLRWKLLLSKPHTLFAAQKTNWRSGAVLFVLVDPMRMLRLQISSNDHTTVQNAHIARCCCCFPVQRCHEAMMFSI